ncbi:MerR family DNA-binding transcriptional regulator [Paenibacillus sepulcri]|uniref:MerR family DNA-binding transcriptional regulator n=1 Tax=Paenibacillus sepulcri TaxID=359917 RepID=A0ABS7BZE6_9BACL|nr:MerR family DNA-binding transcriptional regulator [Paenibacillus sepulcri]
MKISQLSKETGVSARSIRYYEKKKLLTARRLDNDYREFDEVLEQRIEQMRVKRTMISTAIGSAEQLSKTI